MHIFVKATGLDLTGPLKTYIEDKINSLNKLLVHFDPDTVKIQVEIARVSRHHRRGEVYRAEANIELPQDVLRAEETSDDARAAVDALKDKLKREIDSYLSRHGKDHHRGHGEEQ